MTVAANALDLLVKAKDISPIYADIAVVSLDFPKNKLNIFSKCGIIVMKHSSVNF